MKNFKYITPETMEEASRLLREPGAAAMGGGTDLLGVIKDELLPHLPDTVVNLKKLPELSGLWEEEDGLHAGAAVTLRELAESSLVLEKWPALAEAARSVATPNIRNTATLGGNLCQDIRCWYYRYPDILGGKINCARKEGHLCSAMMGENRYHSIFGAAKVCETPCTGKCPAHTDISAYMELIREGKTEEAARVILEVNPMPAITSRVCAHFCMEGCNRNTYDESLNVGAVERYLGDYILENREIFMKGPETENGKRVSIIGSGPAGLTAAYYLRQGGYEVTIYEKQPKAGGCLTYAIPPYRLPKEVVQSFIDGLEAMGIRFRCSCHVGEDVTLEEIAGASDSVMLDTGTWKRPLIGLSGEELTRFGLEFLVDVNNYVRERPGSKVIVVGGGNVAMDVTITAKRLGCPEVTMVCLEQRDSMPANEEEVARALEEKVEILNGWGPKEVIRKDGKVRGMVFKHCPKVLDDTGRFNPVYEEDKVMELSGDIIMMAIGQKADLEFLKGAYNIETERGRIKALDGCRTTEKGIFAGGDVTTGPATVIKAIASGKQVALAVNQYCGLEKLPVETVSSERMGRKLAVFDSKCRSRKEAVKSPMLEIHERDMDKEDISQIQPSQAQAEAGRCFNCGCLAVNPSDTANILYAMDARIVTNQRTISPEEFFGTHTRVQEVLKPGELVKEVVVPHVPQGAVTRYDKFRIRKSIDFAVLAVAGYYCVEDDMVKSVSMVLGAVAPVPMKLTEVEEYLTGKKLTQETAEEAAEIAMRHAVPLEMNSYKIQIAKTMIRRFLGF